MKAAAAPTVHLPEREAGGAGSAHVERSQNVAAVATTKAPLMIQALSSDTLTSLPPKQHA